ncbi:MULTISPECIES: anti-sigma factor domain-containing protein [Clostridium]|uniref:Anti-sigma factor domain-containing protein n=1 Tax=Clostridium aquiflavi TaxID=3073603 RepID=A0ABU1ED23_9CLOT|nr:MULTISPECIES: anti-sigma factor domain-containing protein [unclassified Clostridium]MDR5586237.1 anti-sigma factor domain-containing protein [Clostridium sp. 5N-1]NFG62328.1 anti-sigma factor domain-containing protein [Clostridium botulinum]NFQ10309.1 anti-sigma factor domain-containing protein [Clostridium botulinum]
MDKLRIKYVFSSTPNMLLIGGKTDINRNKQIELFLKKLSLYNILLKDLINYPPKEKQRNIILNISYYILEDDNLRDSVERKKDLPIRNVCKKLDISDEFLRKWKEYILFYYIIFSNVDYKLIQEYLKIEEKSNNVVNLNNVKKTEFFRGIVLKSLNSSAYILTSSGEIIKIKCDKNTKIGQEISGQQKKSFRNYKIYFCILIVLIIIIGMSLYSHYYNSQSTIIVNTTSAIKLECNFLDKVIYSYSETEKGNKLIISTDVLHKDIDESIKEILDYAINNEMIPTDNKILITVNGEALKYGALKETSKFLNEINEKNKSENKSQISVLINNGGNQHKLTTSLYE